MVVNRSARLSLEFNDSFKKKPWVVYDPSSSYYNRLVARFETRKEAINFALDLLEDAKEIKLECFK